MNWTGGAVLILSGTDCLLKQSLKKQQREQEQKLEQELEKPNQTERYLQC